MHLTPLRIMILKNWREFHPTMYQQFVQENRLDQELEATETQMSNLLHQLTVVEKMEYQAAMEIVIDQFLLPEDESSSKK